MAALCTYYGILLYVAFSSEEETAPKLNKRRFVTHGISIISSLNFYSEGEDLWFSCQG